MKQLCVRLDDEVYKKLRVYCFTHGATLTETLHALINGLLAIEPPLTSKPQPAPESKNPFLDDPLEPEPPSPPLIEMPFDNTKLTKGYSARKAKKGSK
jgi:hypothetical protein